MTTPKLSADQLAALKAQFDVIDQDGNGRITGDELATLLRREAYAYLSEAQRQEILDSYARVDFNGDGGVDFDEFVVLVTQHQDPREALRKSFDAFDLDGDGFLTAPEFQRLAEAQGEDVGPEQAENMVKLADTDGDGKVSFDEFYAVMTARHKG